MLVAIGGLEEERASFEEPDGGVREVVDPESGRPAVELVVGPDEAVVVTLLKSMSTKSDL